MDDPSLFDEPSVESVFDDLALCRHLVEEGLEPGEREKRRGILLEHLHEYRTLPEFEDSNFRRGADEFLTSNPEVAGWYFEKYPDEQEQAMDLTP